MLESYSVPSTRLPSRPGTRKPKASTSIPMDEASNPRATMERGGYSMPPSALDTSGSSSFNAPEAL